MIDGGQFWYMSHHMTKPTKWHMHPAKTQISLGICPVWSVFAVGVKKYWVLSYPMSAQRSLWSDWEDAQADLSLLGAQVSLLVLSCCGSCYFSTMLLSLLSHKLNTEYVSEFFFFFLVLFGTKRLIICVTQIWFKKILQFCPWQFFYQEFFIKLITFEWLLHQSLTKSRKRPVRPVKPQINLGICPVWSESFLSAWRRKVPILFLHILLYLL